MNIFQMSVSTNNKQSTHQDGIKKTITVSTLANYSNFFKVHGKMSTYLVHMGPPRNLHNLPFGICAIYFDLKVGDATKLA